MWSPDPFPWASAVVGVAADQPPALVLAHVVAAFDLSTLVGQALLLGALVAALLLGLARLQRSRRDRAQRHTAARTTAEPNPKKAAASLGAAAWSCADPGPLEPPASNSVATRLCAAFDDWLVRHEDEPDLWASFDQLLRELLHQHLAATRVRSFHVRPGRDRLHPLAGPAANAPSNNATALDGLFGHVAVTGQEFVAGDASHGPLLDDLAARMDDAWDWVWPVRWGQATKGVVAVGSFGTSAPPLRHERLCVGGIISLFWEHVAVVDELRRLRRTDLATGALTRSDFFDQARQVLAVSYRDNEPVVVAVLALEGLRGLDDAGCWQQRDVLVDRLGHLLARRLRSDDLVGRFSDDRFVALMRRLDTGLGRLIAEKFLAAAQECVEQFAPIRQRVRLRLGLAGSGFAKLPLDDLLVLAFDAVERARKSNRSLDVDVAEPLRLSESPPRPEGAA